MFLVILGYYEVLNTEAEKIESKVRTLLSGNNELDICVLLKMLNERLK